MDRGGAVLELERLAAQPLVFHHAAVRQEPVRYAVDLLALARGDDLAGAFAVALKRGQEPVDLAVEALQGLVAEEAQLLQGDLLGADLDRGGGAHGAPQVAQRVRNLRRGDWLGDERIHAGLEAGLPVEVGGIGGGGDDDGALRGWLDRAVARRDLRADEPGQGSRVIFWERTSTEAAVRMGPPRSRNASAIFAGVIGLEMNASMPAWRQASLLKSAE